jgi:hypothetical protein
MANPYTSVSISNYNNNPPPDDGSETTPNQIFWATIKTKLTDPHDTAIQSIDTNISSAFGKVPFIDITTLTGAHTVASNERGHLFDVASGTFTLTLLAAATAGAGFTFGIVNNGSGTVTIDGNSTETVNGTTTLVLAPGEGGMFCCDGSNWAGFVASLAQLGITSTAAELNLLDGATVTVDEINELDASAATIAGFQSGIRTHIESENGGDHTGFNIAGLTQATWTTIGPTSTGATSEWTALDSVPATAQAIIVKIIADIQGATIDTWYQAFVYARNAGETTTMSAYAKIMGLSNYNRSGSNEADANVTTHIIPVDSNNHFDLAWDDNNSPTLSAICYLVGWIE